MINEKVRGGQSFEKSLLIFIKWFQNYLFCHSYIACKFGVYSNIFRDTVRFQVLFFQQKADFLMQVLPFHYKDPEFSVLLAFCRICGQLVVRNHINFQKSLKDKKKYDFQTVSVNGTGTIYVCTFLFLALQVSLHTLIIFLLTGRGFSSAGRARRRMTCSAPYWT